MIGTEAQARTIGVLAAEIGAPLPQVNYVLRKLGIQPVGRAGVLRLFDATAKERVRLAIASMEERRARKKDLVRLFTGDTTGV